MLAWILVAVGIFVYVPLWRVAFRHVVRKEISKGTLVLHRGDLNGISLRDLTYRNGALYTRTPKKDLDGWDFVGCFLTATIFFWLVIPQILLEKVSWDSLARTLAGESVADRRARRERELEEIRKSNRKAERELKIGDD